jgi:hypothetical protein
MQSLLRDGPQIQKIMDDLGFQISKKKKILGTSHQMAMA